MRNTTLTCPALSMSTDVSFYAKSVVVCSLLPCCHLLGRADLLALVGDVNCIFVTFPCGILGQVWYLIVSFPDFCRLSYYTRKLHL